MAADEPRSLASYAPHVFGGVMLVAAFAFAGHQMGQNASAHNMAADEQIADLTAPSPHLITKGSLMPDVALDLASFPLAREQEVLSSAKGGYLDDDPMVEVAAKSALALPEKRVAVKKSSTKRDGRIVIAAAKDFGARGVGYEIDPALIRESRILARRAGVTASTQFLENDLFDLAFSKPSVVTLYLLPEYNAKLKPLLLAQMRPGSRVVSHEWDMGDWLPDETLLFPAPDKPHGMKKEHRLMLWVIPALASGRWRANLANAHEAVEIVIEQHYQAVTATANRGNVLWSSLRGSSLSVAWQDGSARWLLRGVVNGNHWRGDVTKLGAWSNTTSEQVVRFEAQR